MSLRLYVSTRLAFQPFSYLDREYVNCYGQLARFLASSALSRVVDPTTTTSAVVAIELQRKTTSQLVAGQPHIYTVTTTTTIRSNRADKSLDLAQRLIISRPHCYKQLPKEI